MTRKTPPRRVVSIGSSEVSTWSISDRVSPSQEGPVLRATLSLPLPVLTSSRHSRTQRERRLELGR